MRVLFDHLCFWERYGGVSKYFVELLSRIPKDERLLTVHFTNQNEYISALDDVRVKSLFGQFSFRGKARVVSEIGKMISLPYIIGGKYDIYHPTHYDTYAFPFLKKNVRTVATIHDLNYFKIPELYSPQSRLASQEIKMANRVDHIITISENTKKDIIDFWKIPEERISVIYHGINPIKYEPGPSPHTGPYILYVGRRNKYKNFEGVVEAFRAIANRFKSLDLVCAGLPFSEYEKDLLKRAGILHRCFSYQASEQKLYQLYSHAQMFVFPSFYEGFGMPILEAMAARCPVILSKASCFPEIAGDAGLFFDPYSVDDIADKISKVISSDSLRLSLIEAGNKQVEKFSWDKCASQHMEVYKSLV